MGSTKFLPVFLFLFLVIGSFAQDDTTETSESTTADVVASTISILPVADISPPNCVCPVVPVTTTTTTTTTTRRPGRFPWARPLPMRKPRFPTHLCGNDGQNYLTLCDFINAQADNEDLGLVLCAGQKLPNLSSKNRGGFRNGPERPMPIGFPGFENCDASIFSSSRREPRVCMTDGETLTIRGVVASLRTNSTVGVRCPGCCPCNMRCPPAFIAGYPGAFYPGRY